MVVDERVDHCNLCKDKKSDRQEADAMEYDGVNVLIVLCIGVLWSKFQHMGDGCAYPQ